MVDNFSVSHPFVTVQEASFLCDVSHTTIQTKIKEYKMKTYLDDKGRIHIRTLDVLLYYHKQMIRQISKTEKELHKAINDRNKTLSEYYELAREYDDQLYSDDVYISLHDLTKKYQEICDASLKIKQIIESINSITDFYNTIT